MNNQSVVFASQHAPLHAQRFRFATQRKENLSPWSSMAWPGHTLLSSSSKTAATHSDSLGVQTASPQSTRTRSAWLVIHAVQTRVKRARPLFYFSALRHSHPAHLRAWLAGRGGVPSSTGPFHAACRLELPSRGAWILRNFASQPLGDLRYHFLINSNPSPFVRPGHTGLSIASADALTR